VILIAGFDPFFMGMKIGGGREGIVERHKGAFYL
jgi:hypothetical protein